MLSLCIHAYVKFYSIYPTGVALLVIYFALLLDRLFCRQCFTQKHILMRVCYQLRLNMSAKCEGPKEWRKYFSFCNGFVPVNVSFFSFATPLMCSRIWIIEFLRLLIACLGFPESSWFVPFPFTRFNPVVGGGPNASIIHYSRNDQKASSFILYA